MVAASGAWNKRAVLSLLINHGCVVGMTEGRLSFILKARYAAPVQIAVIMVDLPVRKECSQTKQMCSCMK